MSQRMWQELHRRTDAPLWQANTLHLHGETMIDIRHVAQIPLLREHGVFRLHKSLFFYSVWSASPGSSGGRRSSGRLFKWGWLVHFSGPPALLCACVSFMRFHAARWQMAVWERRQDLCGSRSWTSMMANSLGVFYRRGNSVTSHVLPGCWRLWCIYLFTVLNKLLDKKRARDGNHQTVCESVEWIIIFCASWCSIMVNKTTRETSQSTPCDQEKPCELQ